MKDKLQKIVHYLPKNIQKLVLSYYNSLGFKKSHINRTHQLDFPIKAIDGSFNFDRPLFGNDRDEGYFTQYYDEPEIPPVFLTIGEKLSLKTETLKGKLYTKDQSIALNIKSESILPISLTKKNFEGSFLDNKALICLQMNVKKIQLEGLAINRFHYLPIPKNITVNINSNYDLIIGKPLMKKNEKKIKNKLTLVIFIDGFSAEIFKKENLDRLMPNTYKFFKNGVIFNRCYATSEWTLPSFTSIFSGRYLKNHKIYHPDLTVEIGKEYPIISDFFYDSGYMTFLSGGNWRATPSYGYCKNFDRTIYKHSMRDKEVIESFVKNLKSFKDRSHFCWLTFMDLHHDINLIPAIDEQVNLPLTTHSYKKEQVNTPFLSYSENRVKRYMEKIRSLDYSLKEVYDYILENFKNEEILVALVSDHGQGYIDQRTELLSEQRAHVPLMIRGSSIKSEVSEEIIQNIDLLPTLLHLNNIEFDLKSMDGVIPCVFGGIGRQFSFFESRYPGQTYKVRVKDESYEFYFETKLPVDKKGKLNLSEYTFKLYDIKSGKQVEDVKEKMKKYIEIIICHNSL